MQVPVFITVIITVIVGLVCLIAGAAAGYQRRKAAAERAWAKIRPGEELQAEILAALEQAKQSQDWQKEGGQYIPYPATWLNARGWEDELESAAPERRQPTFTEIAERLERGEEF